MCRPVYLLFSVWKVHVALSPSSLLAIVIIYYSFNFGSNRSYLFALSPLGYSVSLNLGPYEFDAVVNLETQLLAPF
jgi:hypothetical protein